MRTIAMVSALAMVCLGGYAREITHGLWTVSVDDESRKVTVLHNGEAIFNDVHAYAAYNRAGSEEELSVGRDNGAPELSEESVTDCFGSGEAVVFTYSAGDGVKLRQSLTFYENLPYFIARGTLSGAAGEELRSNAIVPFEAGDYSTPLGGVNNRILWVPFDNDGHGFYECNKISVSGITGGKHSHEVGCVYNVDSRRGIVAGSVDHDNWKNGVFISGQYQSRITDFSCLSGLANSTTRDGRAHGKVKGETVSSARFLIGVFDDWRVGMETFADANVKVVPPAKWDGGTPVGWSSYGSQQEYVSYAGVMESARFMKDELYPLGFHDRDGRITISLDAFGEDNIAAPQLVTMATKAFGDGTTYNYGGKKYDGMNMTLGLYGGPLTIWEWTLDSKVPGTGMNGERDYTFRDMALKVNGELYKVPSNGAYASDPTHPAAEALIRTFLKNFAARGAKYAKIDFMNCGIIEGDSYYNPEITTGVQAYNYAMKMVMEEAEKYGIYLVMAMSPAFPYQYAHGRRTCCDRFSELGESQYVMNATSYGWWYDRLYAVNDPDQMVLCKNNYKCQETEGENRVRATTGMTTGAFIFGDDFCESETKNTSRSYAEEARRRAKIIMGNEDINAYVRDNMGSFRPVEGEEYFYNSDKNSRYASERIFHRHTDRYDYVAVFNFSKIQMQIGTVEWSRLGIDPDNVGAIKELWFGTEEPVNAEGLHFEVPKGDVRVYRIANASYGGVETAVADGNGVKTDVILLPDGGCNVMSSGKITAVRVYGVDGRVLGSRESAGENELSLHVAGNAAMAIVEITFAGGEKEVRKVVCRR